MKKSVIIIGGGAAGLTAAAALAEKGIGVKLFESRPFTGGRIYSFIDPVTKDHVDNGQHLFAGFYYETFKFLSMIDSISHITKQKRLTIDFMDKVGNLYKFRSPKLPAPLHLLAGLFNYKKFPKGDLFRLVKNIRKMRDNVDDMSAADMLGLLGQSETAQANFFQPLALATLNADLNEVSGRLFQEMMEIILTVPSSHSVLAYSTVGFSELISLPAEKYIIEKGGEIFRSNAVKEICVADGKIEKVVDSTGKSWSADAYIVALPPDALDKIVPKGLMKGLDQWEFSPIVSVNIWFKEPVKERPMLGFLGGKFHWFFDKSRLIKDPNQHKYVSLLASSAYDKIALPKETIIEEAMEDMKKYFPWAVSAEVLHSQVIQERKATVLITSDKFEKRPQVRTRIPNLFLAGDWIQTNMPATVESAVKSGFLAAEQAAGGEV